VDEGSERERERKRARESEREREREREKGGDRHFLQMCVYMYYVCIMFVYMY
jgi:hypothetical protein